MDWPGPESQDNPFFFMLLSLEILSQQQKEKLRQQPLVMRVDSSLVFIQENLVLKGSCAPLETILDQLPPDVPRTPQPTFGYTLIA